MLNLIATGKSSLDNVTSMYLWGYGNYKYEIEKVASPGIGLSEVFDSTYEFALDKFGKMVNTVNFAEEVK